MTVTEVLNSFFTAIRNNPRISITHIGIYAGLLEYWCMHGQPSTMRVFSYEIMELAKVSTKTTYHKCIKELADYGYIIYRPSFNRNKGSEIFFSVESGSIN
ncbi:hypothetical protein [Mucilaginibacter defluvii]|uniref:Transcriptional regulator n=1 Tax=Mucilaginibacter defluvii TaxID=1196019 RepID=A0ABP9FKP4_9SPHI